MRFHGERGNGPVADDQKGVLQVQSLALGQDGVVGKATSLSEVNDVATLFLVGKEMIGGERLLDSSGTRSQLERQRGNCDHVSGLRAEAKVLSLQVLQSEDGDLSGASAWVQAE